MTALLVGVLLIVVVVLLSRQRRVRIRSCCSSGPWPPVDLIEGRTDLSVTAEPDAIADQISRRAAVRVDAPDDRPLTAAA